jgi:hypothetical protein
MRLSAVATVLLLATPGCVKEISSEEHLDRETQGMGTSGLRSTPDAAELGKVHCDDTGDALNQARNVNRPETERLADYMGLYAKLQQNNATFEEAMTRNPDLNYIEGSQKLVAARDNCIQQAADVRVEFETYVRELVSVPTVQEIKGGNTVTVARLDFDTLRQAIEALNPDDKEALMSRVANAERTVAPSRPEEDPAAASGAGKKGRGK